MRRKMTTVVAVTLALLAVASNANATDTVTDVPEVHIDGVGKLVAHGRGKIAIHGAGWVKLKMAGDVKIVDHAGDATIEVRWADSDAFQSVDDTTVILEDFVGVIVVRGSDFTIKARGRFRRIYAAGRGVAFLKGRGWYRATGGYYGTWTNLGIRVIYVL